MVITIYPGRVSAITGPSRSSRYTPALTMVAECRRALVGVGATIAPSSQPLNGICALFVSAAKARHATGSITSAFPAAEVSAVI